MTALVFQTKVTKTSEDNIPIVGLSLALKRTYMCTCNISSQMMNFIAPHARILILLRWCGTKCNLPISLHRQFFVLK